MKLSEVNCVDRGKARGSNRKRELEVALRVRGWNRLNRNSRETARKVSATLGIKIQRTSGGGDGGSKSGEAAERRRIKEAK